MPTAIHRCQCPQCQAHRPHPDRVWHHQINMLMSRLNEPQRRWFAAVEALRIGHGGKRLLGQITGLSRTTILRGCRELQSGLAHCPVDLLRSPGGGRPAAQVKDPQLQATLDTVLATETAGDPMGRRRQARRSTLRQLSTKLTTAGHPVSRTTVGKLLHQMKYAQKANARRVEARGASLEQRHAQFEHIGEQRDQFTATKDPIISVDTKKKS
jgi:Rhodopirellula transposase DDE domain